VNGPNKSKGKTKKRKGKIPKESDIAKQSKKKLNRRQRKAIESNSGLDTEVELTDDDRKSKKQKTSKGHPMPLRRTG
jgi:hypothetical protein